MHSGTDSFDYRNPAGTVPPGGGTDLHPGRTTGTVLPFASGLGQSSEYGQSKNGDYDHNAELAAPKQDLTEAGMDDDNVEVESHEHTSPK